MYATQGKNAHYRNQNIRCESILLPKEMSL